MLSLEHCRRLLPPGATLTDDGLLKLRDELYCIAGLTLRAVSDALPQDDGKPTDKIVRLTPFPSITAGDNSP